MNHLFFTEGNDPFSHLRAHTANVQSAPFEGIWTTVEIQPDAFTRQRFTVGVLVGSIDGAFSFRLLDDFSKFECLYGREDVAAIRLLLDAAEHSLLRARKANARIAEVDFESDALSLGDLWPTSGASIDAVLSRLYVDVVPFLSREEKKARDFVTLDNSAVRRIVDEQLKLISGMDFSRITTEPQRAVRDKDTGEFHLLDFNLEPAGKAGSVISAVYKTPDRIELNFLRASRDLATYARLRSINERLAIFVMQPHPQSMPVSDLNRIEDVLGEQSWSLEQQGFIVSTHDDPALVARDAWQWANLPN